MRANIMKALVHAAIIAVAITVPALSFAQSSNAPVTRAQVRAQLAAVEAAGYRPGGDDPTYPADIQAAEARVAAQSSDAAKTSYGGMATTGSSQSGVAAPTPGQ
jgi:Domain of unknown function (DUF4148)